MLFSFSDYLERESKVSINAWNGSYLNISSDKKVDYKRMQVVYNVLFTDIGNAARARPGNYGYKIRQILNTVRMNLQT